MSALTTHSIISCRACSRAIPRSADLNARSSSSCVSFFPMSSPLVKLMSVRATSVVRRAARHIGCAGVFHVCSVFFLPESVSPKHP